MIDGSTEALAFAFERGTAAGPLRWTIFHPVAKLVLRAKLPGAHAFDHASHALRAAAACGVPTIDLLPLALPASWLVNNAAPSTTFKKWLAPALRPRWQAVLDALDAGDSPTPGDIDALCMDGHGAGALSKVLALLAPEAVPLLPDAAIAFAMGTVAAPEALAALDAQTAGAAQLVPMVEWFRAVVRAHADPLRAIALAEAAARDGVAVLTPGQVFDRLLWFESAGYRHFHGKIVGGGAYLPIAESADAPDVRGIVYVPAERAG